MIFHAEKGMACVVVSRAWRGETPYIRSWLNYYLDVLGFDKALILRCDEERFQFIEEEFGERVEFHDRPATSPEAAFAALVDFEIPRHFDYVFSCDIDEYLVLHGKRIHEIDPHDSRFFWWALCCSTDPSTGDLRDNLRLGVRSGHDGKTLFKTDKAIRFYNEHRAEMEPRSEIFYEKDEFIDSPYVLHFSSRGIEDLIIRSLWQAIKVEVSKSRYSSCMSRPPERFEDLPLRFKVAYLQTRLKKTPFRCDIPSLPVDLDRLESLFELTKIRRGFGPFLKTYDIDDLIKDYPRSLHGTQEDFAAIVGELPRSPDKIMI